jgi:thiol-disulfide isomerase/thioredoxin
MKTGIILVLVASSLIITSLSAAEMTDTMMVKKDSMLTDSSTMKMYDRMSVVAIAKQMGYTWKSDRMKIAKMAGINGYRGTAKQNMMIRNYLLKSMKMTTGESMMKHDDSMKKDMMKESGMYTAYSASAVTASLAAGKSVYLFFHATWCPACRSLDSSVSGDLVSIPTGTVIYKFDYDTNEALRQQYGVTSQHTIVKLNSDGTLMKKTMGAKNIMEIIK